MNTEDMYRESPGNPRPENGYWTEVIIYVVQHGLRVGQALYNALPNWALDSVCGTVIDPFHKHLSFHEGIEWANNHLVFDGENVAAVHNGDTILATRPS